MNDIDVVVVCDLVEDRMQKGKKLVEDKYGHEIDGTLNYHDILERKDIDCVLIPTSWNAHYKIAIECNGSRNFFLLLLRWAPFPRAQQEGSCGPGAHP